MTWSAGSDGGLSFDNMVLSALVVVGAVKVVSVDDVFVFISEE